MIIQFISKARIIIFLSTVLVIAACGGGRDAASKGNDQDFEELRELVQSREFEIENRWVMPLRGSMINLIGNPNFIRFEGDSVDVFLPYFGVRQFGGNYGGRDGGIIYEGPLEDLEIRENEARNSIELKFNGEHETEDLQFFIRLYENGNANTAVNSSQRDAVSYRGQIVELTGEEEEKTD